MFGEMKSLAMSFFKMATNVQATACQPNTLDGFGWQVVAIVVGCLFFFTNILKIFVFLFCSVKISRIFVKEITTKTIEIMTALRNEMVTVKELSKRFVRAKYKRKQ